MSKVQETVREKYRSMTPSQFFYEHREIAGFGSPSRALYQTIRELVENALDATDVYGIKPRIMVVIERLEDNPDHYRITVEDNGIGINPKYVPQAFGQVLFSSKYKLRQARGRFGLGAKMAILYGQIKTGKPVEVYTSPIGFSKIYYYKLKIDIEHNRPIILSYAEHENKALWHGTRISVVIEGDWSRARSRVYEYIKRTAIATPYADIIFIDPEGNMVTYKHSIDKMPRPPREVKPHPHGVDIEQLKRLIKDVQANSMLEFLVSAFQGVGRKTAEAFLKWAKIDPNLNPQKLSDSFLSELARKLREYPKFRPPSADSLSPFGPEIIEAGLRAILKPEFVVAVSRRPKAYEGHPFIIEVGIAYGGEIPPANEPLLLRYANKIPLLYDEKSDVAWKVVDPRNFNWKDYMVVFPAPIAVLTHIASTKVPYKGVGKESVADVPEIEHELRNALREAARKLRLYLMQKRREEEAKRRVITFVKYTPEVAKSLATILKDVDEKTVQEMLLTAMKRRLRLEDEDFVKLVEGLEVSIEE
ncbi:DNA topoisomerase VI subunit B [Pyrofollis japonicus]|uniref:DNA topoisomerase VI subunit B n=1 Tax=Pyrofollis japonicus TaxID=3060460 RepID=UPI00295B8358|nr:DNA topoisomerase VI subunit B [Pyrofollis japonicus]BEP16976.1 DNA topoisomerase VI subunit B [Pyrofollis japonicus]